MTDSSADLTFAAKLNRLFAVCHARDAPELPAQHVADGVSRLIGRRITVDQIDALRSGTARTMDSALIDALAEYFSVPREYLATSGAHARDLDDQLRLLAAARDAGVRHLALRGSRPDVGSLLDVLDRLAAPPEGSGQHGQT
jgi:hypothetical protein